MTEINNDLTKTTVWENRKAILICTVVATASFQYGLDVGLIGGFQSMTGFLEVFGYRDPATLNGWNLTSTVQQLITSLMTLGAFVGSLLAGPVSTYLNRRMSICLASVLCIVSTFILIFTTSLGALYFARLLLGIAKYAYFRSV